MNQRKPPIPWSVEFEANVLARAQQEIEHRFQGVNRKDMEGWLDRFLVGLRENPLDVLGFPPKKASSNPDLIYFPGDHHRKISGLAYASLKQRTIYVYEIKIQERDKGEL